MAGREVGEVRKRLGDEPDESAPFVGYARALLGELKADMAYAGLQQGVRRRSIDGAQIEVSSVFGQDEIRITPEAVEQDPKQRRETTDEFLPYLWVGARLVGVSPDDATLLLFVWEPGEHERITDSIVSTRAVYPTTTYGPTSTFPLGNLENATANGTKVYYNANRLIAYANATDKDGVVWDQVVVGDDDDKNPEMQGFKTKLIEGAYQVAACLTGDECADPPISGSVEIKVIAGKGKYVTTFVRTFPIKAVTRYNRALYPYGYYGPTSSNDGTPDPDYDQACLNDTDVTDDHGSNPHWDNWMDGCITAFLPSANTSLYAESRAKNGEVTVELDNPLRIASIGHGENLPPGFEPNSDFSDERRCDGGLGYLWVVGEPLAKLMVSGGVSALKPCCDWLSENAQFYMGMNFGVPRHIFGAVYITDYYTDGRSIADRFKERFDERPLYLYLNRDEVFAALPGSASVTPGAWSGWASSFDIHSSAPFGHDDYNPYLNTWLLTLISCPDCNSIGGGMEYQGPNYRNANAPFGQLVATDYPQGKGYPDNDANLYFGYVTSSYPDRNAQYEAWTGLDLNTSNAEAGMYTTIQQIDGARCEGAYDSLNKTWFFRTQPDGLAGDDAWERQYRQYAADNRLHVITGGIWSGVDIKPLCYIGT